MGSREHAVVQAALNVVAISALGLHPITQYDDDVAACFILCFLLPIEKPFRMASKFNIYATTLNYMLL